MKKLPAILLFASMLALPMTGVASDSQPVPAGASANANEKSKERRSKKKNADKSNQAKLQACEETLEVTKRQAETASRSLAKAEEKLKSSLDLVSKVNALETEVRELRDQKLQAEQALTRIHAKTTEGTSSASETSVKQHEEALKEIDNCLTKASSKAKELGEVIRNAQREKVLAQERSKKTTSELTEVRTQMERMVTELGEMKTRDRKNNTQLKALESKLAAATQEAKRESEKLLAAGQNLSSWESRAKRAESDLERTKQAMQTSLKVANEAKALGTQYQDKLSISATQLAERSTSLNTTLAALKQAQVTASECQARVSALQAELDQQSKRYEATALALKSAESERNSYRKGKLAAEKSLTLLKGELVTAQRTAQQLPQLREKIGALEATIKSQQEAETLREKEATRLAKSSTRMQTRLDEILMQREELSDHLTILRNEFAQYRITTSSNQERLAKAGINQLQTALAKESTAHNAALQERDARLTQLEETLKSKEEALQSAYQREKDTSAKLGQAEKARQDEAGARESLTKALEKLRTDLEDSQKKACQLKEQLVELEALSLEN